GIPQTAKLSPMPQFSDLSDQQITAIARWIHYARQQGRYRELTSAPTVAGDAMDGKTYFEQNCAACHSTAGELARISSRDAAKLREAVLQPTSLETARTYRVDQREDAKYERGREQHHHLLENYTTQNLANVIAFLQSVQNSK